MQDKKVREAGDSDPPVSDPPVPSNIEGICFAN